MSVIPWNVMCYSVFFLLLLFRYFSPPSRNPLSLLLPFTFRFVITDIENRRQIAIFEHARVCVWERVCDFQPHTMIAKNILPFIHPLSPRSTSASTSTHRSSGSIFTEKSMGNFHPNHWHVYFSKHIKPFHYYWLTRSQTLMLEIWKREQL